MHFSSLLQRMFEHQTQQILEQPQERITELCQCLVYCIRNPLHEVQESGFRAILSFAMFIRQNSAPPSLAHVLESILAETMASLFVGGVDSESVSNACAAVHGLAIVLPVNFSLDPADGRTNMGSCFSQYFIDVKARSTNDLDKR